LAISGHFGREPVEMNYDAPDGSNGTARKNGPSFTAFTWERTDRAEALRKAAGI
jgi:S-adenosylmethionine synthetase